MRIYKWEMIDQFFFQSRQTNYFDMIRFSLRLVHVLQIGVNISMHLMLDQWQTSKSTSVQSRIDNDVKFDFDGIKSDVYTVA